MNIKPFQTQSGVGANPITFEQAQMFLTEEDINKGEKRGQLKTYGPWQIPISYKALAVSQDFSIKYSRPVTVFGYRTLTNIRESGFELEGRVSVNNKKYRGFTSSQLFELPNKKLINVAVIFVCGYFRD